MTRQIKGGTPLILHINLLIMTSTIHPVNTLTWWQWFEVSPSSLYFLGELKWWNTPLIRALCKRLVVLDSERKFLTHAERVTLVFAMCVQAQILQHVKLCFDHKNKTFLGAQSPYMCFYQRNPGQHLQKQNRQKTKRYNLKIQSSSCSSPLLFLSKASPTRLTCASDIWKLSI